VENSPTNSVKKRKGKGTFFSALIKNVREKKKPEKPGTSKLLVFSKMSGKADKGTSVKVQEVFET